MNEPPTIPLFGHGACRMVHESSYVGGKPSIGSPTVESRKSAMHASHTVRNCVSCGKRMFIVTAKSARKSRKSSSQLTIL